MRGWPVGVPRPAKTRAKISRALKGIKRSPELRAKWSAMRKGVSHGPQPNISAALRGVKKTRAHALAAAAATRAARRANAGGAFKYEKDPSRVGGREYDAWRKSVKRRDGHRCQKCSAKRGGLHAHHRLPREVYPEFRYDVEIGITSCVRCHTKYERQDIRLLLRILRENCSLSQKQVKKLFLARCTR
jgi:hypothetical protein